MKKLIVSTVLASCLAVQAQAQSANRYSSWSDPNAPQAVQSGDLNKLVRELRDLVNDAERSRAADPNFLRDLKKLANKYEKSTSKLLFKDDFLDDNLTVNPKWMLASGKYWVERGYGLRSFVEPNAATSSNGSSSRKISKEEAIIGLLGAVLGGQVQQQGSGSQAQQAPTDQAQAAEIYLPTPVSNAFSLEMELSSWQNQGMLSFGPYQGTGRNTGYRLVYRPSQTPALQLYRNYKSGGSIVDSVAQLNLEDKKNHKLIWSRTSSGDMKVSLDGKTLMQVTDRGFKDDFSGFVMTNSGGDYIIKSISMMGL